MDLRYVAFTRADPHFYDRIRTVTRPDTSTDQHFIPAKSGGLVRSGGAVPKVDRGTTSNRPTVCCQNKDGRFTAPLPEPTRRSCSITVSVYCGHNHVPFKFLRTAADLMLSNSKQANRTSSGKIHHDLSGGWCCHTTCHHRTGQACRRCRRAVHPQRCAMEPGDRSTYGTARICPCRPTIHSAIASRQFGVLTDRSNPMCAALPSELRTGYKSRTSFRAQQDKLKSHDEFPYSITEALHFSNSGGIYSAFDDAGIDLVIKEGRPFTAPDANGRYAIDRIRNEYDKLTHLADNPYTPSAISLFEREGHHFLVTERAAGTPLNQEVALRHPLIRADQTLSSRTEYRTWALDIAQQLTTAVESFHNAGIVHADLHPGNVMCSPSGIRIIDFEMAHNIDEQPPRVHRGSRVHSTSTVDRNRGGIDTRWDASSWDSLSHLLHCSLSIATRFPELIDYAVSRSSIFLVPSLPRSIRCSTYRRRNRRIARIVGTRRPGKTCNGRPLYCAAASSPRLISPALIDSFPVTSPSSK